MTATREDVYEAMEIIQPIGYVHDNDVQFALGSHKQKRLEVSPGED